MNSSARLISTIAIWTALTLCMITIAAALTSSETEIDHIGGAFVLAIVFVLARAATLSTRAIWSGSFDETDKDTMRVNLARLTNKPKRHDYNRAERLIAALDDDEIYDLETLLLARQPDHRDGNPMRQR
ncbi:MAG: hypothetical protein JW966_08115 [Anaerolineae bacterium]|nr:hypothetical protein [Anaerolineae bacterium]